MRALLTFIATMVIGVTFAGIVDAARFSSLASFILGMTYMIAVSIALTHPRVSA